VGVRVWSHCCELVGARVEEFVLFNVGEEVGAKVIPKSRISVSMRDEIDRTVSIFVL
jgi:adenosyl cobinamide kinase/adenosyl cobinamide phosphate guanylyltransferase